jgi:flagellar motor switch protein FliM
MTTTEALLQVLKSQPHILFDKYFFKIFRKKTKVKFIESQTMLAHDYVTSLGDNQYYSTYGVAADSYGFLHTDYRLFFSIIEKELGSNREPYIKDVAQELTNLEKKSMERIHKDLILPVLFTRETFEKKRFNYQSFYHYPLDLCPALNKKVLILSFEVELDHGPGIFSISI